MGSGESRFQQRRNDIDDLNTVGINYVGGHGYNQAEFDPCCPVDKIVLAYGEDKEPTTLFQIDDNELKAKSEENMLKVYVAILCCLYLKKIRLENKFSIVQDPKATLTGQKYHREDALYQISRTIRALKELSGLKGGDEVEQECEAAVAKKKEEKEQRKMEDVERGLKPKERKKMRTTMKPKDDDKPNYEPEDNLDDFKGWVNLPKLCLKVVAENPYLFDSIKCETLRWEFRLKDKKKKYKKEKYMGPLAGIIGEMVRHGSAIAKEQEKLWLAGVLGPNDLQGLLEMYRKEDRNLQDKKKVAFADPEKSDIDAKGAEPPAEGTEAEKPSEEVMKEGGKGEQPSAGDSKAGNADDSMAGTGKEDDQKKDEKEEKVDEKVINKILVPGISRAYSSYEDAIDSLNFDCQSKQEGIAYVIFEVDNAKCWTGLKNNVKFVHRLFCSLMTHQTITMKQTTVTEVKKADDNQQIDSSAANQPPTDSKDSQEQAKKAAQGSKKVEESELYIHHFKMAAEPRQFLMTVDQWQVQKKSNEAADRKEIEIEEIDASDIPKATVIATQRAETDGDVDDTPEDDKKECIIF